MKQILKNKKGFTLIEIIIVLVILAILSAIAIPSMLGYVEESRDAEFIAIGSAVNSEASILLKEKISTDPDMTEEEFKKLIIEFKGKFMWLGQPGTENPISKTIKYDMPELYQIRSIDFNFDGELSSNRWVYDSSVKHHKITKICISLQKTETPGTQKPLNEFVFIVTIPNKDIFIYNSMDEALEAMEKNPEVGPIFPS